MSVEWIAILCGLLGSGFGAFVGVKVAIASLKERVSVLEIEVRGLREAKHEHAGFLTRHETEIHLIKHRIGME